VSKETLWNVIKTLRQQDSIKTIIKDVENKNFTWSKLDYFEELIHNLDLHTGGELFVDSSKDKNTKQQLISRGVLEEAIASSQLEGANTTRVVAKKLIQEGRKPSNKSEQMIVNNYISLRAIEDEYQKTEMSMDILLELHSLITKDTKDDEDESPRMRIKNETIKVVDKATGEIYHEAPKISFVEKELEKLIRFSNNELGESFIHPVIKAIIIHFWIGYLHPFTDGNGRLARIVFYWYLIKNGYWAFMYLPISKMIKKSPQQYAMAYVYSEQDDNDLTYFIDYNLKKIKLALDDFKEYIDKKTKENVVMKKNVEEKYSINFRQINLLKYFYGDEEARTNISAHMSINSVSKKTAIKDLKDLENDGFLESKKMGRQLYYFGSKKIKKYFVQK
jgi:Fic family protein